MKKFMVMGFALGLAGCMGTTTAAPVDPMATQWQLVELNGDAIPAGATLMIAEDSVSGNGVCNTFHGRREGALPTFMVDNIAATRRACLKPSFNENEYFKTLENVVTATFSGDMMTLSNDAGDSLVFKASQ